jgi:hypothetical protein
MKKGIIAILAVLTVFAMVSCGGGGGSEKKKGSLTKPDLAPLTGGNYEQGSVEDTSIRVLVRNAAAIGAGNLSYKWYKGESATAAGEAVDEDDPIVGNVGRDFWPDVSTVGDTWYWVVVTNTETEEFSTSTKAKVTIYETSNTNVEFVKVANAAMPLWEFTLPEGADWADYEEISVEYYVKKTSKIAQSGVTVRSRSYGAYIAADIDTPDQNNDKGWGGFKIVSWNDNTLVKRYEADGETEITGINPNNDFILDNTKGGAAAFTSLFSDSVGVGTGKWFKVTYTTNAGLAKDFAKVPELDNDVNPIYVGAGIFGPGGDSENVFDYYARNATLINKTAPAKNITGKPTVTGTTTPLFAGNLGSPRAGTERTILDKGDTSYMDLPGISIVFDLKGGAGDFAPVTILPGDSMDDKFPAATPTRKFYTFDKWVVVDGETETTVTASTKFDDNATVVAKWNPDGWAKTPVTVSLTSQTIKNTEAWATQYSNGLVLAMGITDSAKYEKITIVAKYYDESEAAVDEIGAGNMQVKYYYGATEAPANANVAQLATSYNLGQGGTLNETTKEITWSATIPSLAVAANEGNGFNYIGIQSSNGTLTAQYIEVMSITLGW